MECQKDFCRYWVRGPRLLWAWESVAHAGYIFFAFVSFSVVTFLYLSSCSVVRVDHVDLPAADGLVLGVTLSASILAC